MSKFKESYANGEVIVLRVKERGFCSLAEGSLEAEPTKHLHREEEKAKN